MQVANCCSKFGQNVKDELWSYCALAGILFINTSIVLLVYAYKRATPFPLVVEIFGIALLVLGVLSTLASWYVHRQQRQKKRACFWPPCCCRCFRGRGSVAVAASKNISTPSSSASSMRKAKFARNGKLFGAKGGEAHGGERGITPGGEGSGRPFNTPEFRRYAEFVSQKTAGVERGTRRSNLDSPRSNRSVYPGDGKPLPAFVNPRFKPDETNSAPRPSTIESKKTTTRHVTLHMQI
ncbi:hypothetical protein RRG08_040233 [Elysia crispata]|uniref:Uncharacterized protein n=1 Tax=Elysia crispata TaxID=231223 RepID=A0AAE1CYR4_9GAST|nr:hypothetical protein RRG08_040233 [Elysia crispata]